MKLNKEDKELINKTYDFIRNCKFKSTGMGAGLTTSNGNLFFGCSLSVECPAAVCAEPIAIGQMIVSGESKIDTIVAVYYNGKIYPPCGCCRELMSGIGIGNPWVIINKTSKLKLKDLLPKSNLRFIEE